MCVVETVGGTTLSTDGRGKSQKSTMKRYGNTCDSSNCVYCQENAQRFGEIVRQYYHHAENAPTKCGGHGHKGENRLCNRDFCANQSAMSMAHSSIWDYENSDVDRQLDAVVHQRNDCFLKNGVSSKREWLELGRFTGCWQNGDDCNPSVDIVCGLEFEESGWLLAAAGVSKQVRVYSLAKLLEEETSENDPIRMHRLASKLSSLCWNPSKNGVVSVGDYDGVVTEIDLETGHIIDECDGHSGRRVWSVSHSKLQVGTMASASEDGNVVLWDCNRNVVMKISPHSDIGGSMSPITGVQMSPWDANLVSIASASSCGYIYDIRYHNRPLRVLQGHQRPVSYVKFLDQNTLVTAGIDSSLIAWNVSSGAKEQVFKGHCNNKHFVGLSVRPEDGLISCGSETGEVFCYERGQSTAIASHVPSRFQSSNKDGVFCSAIAWQPATASLSSKPILASASTDGSVDVCLLQT